MGNIIGGIVGGIGSYAAGREQARAIREAGARAERLVQPFIGPGVGANTQLLNLLGIGDDPAAGQQAFENFLGSTGFQSQLQAGQQAITGSAAAAGLLQSGATLRRLNRFGQGLAQQGFTNYLAQLQDIAQRGAGAATGAAGGTLQAGTGAAAAAARGQAGLQAGLGQAFQGAGNWLGGRTNFFGVPITGGVR